MDKSENPVNVYTAKKYLLQKYNDLTKKFTSILHTVHSEMDCTAQFSF
jgi:hypothetical protein